MPQLPSPKDLQPFPTVLSMIYKGHTSMVRSITLEPFGQYFASGSDDGTVKGMKRKRGYSYFNNQFNLVLHKITLIHARCIFTVWEIATGRCMKTFGFEGIVRWVEWCPNKAVTLLAVAVDLDVCIINPGVGDKLVVEKTDALLKEGPAGEVDPSAVPEKVSAVVQWEPVDEEKWDKGIRILIRHFKKVNQVREVFLKIDVAFIANTNIG